MSQIEVERFLGRLITDADFRTRAASSLEKIVGTEGVNLSKEELLLLAGIDYALFGRVAETLDHSIRRT